MSAQIELLHKVKVAWAGVEPSPAVDMQHMEWGWGEEAARAFVGVRPVDVDINSSGFQCATPLFDLSSSAAAAYLGSYLISLLDGIDLQEKAGFATDIATRSHTISALLDPAFWRDVVGTHLSRECLEVLGQVVLYLVSMKDMLVLTDAEIAQFNLLTEAIRSKLKR